MPLLQIISLIVAGIYVATVTVLATYGLHSLWLLGLFLRHRRAALALAAAEDASALPADADLPRVLVQLPVFNERDVVERLVEAVGRLDWPRDRLVIQLLDDSTDDSVVIGENAMRQLRARGLDAVQLHRVDRRGYKAGALEAGLAQDDAPFVAIFDADFVPPVDFLRRAIKPLLADARLALVQGRWDHLNRDDNLLTAAQALGIDGHFAIEQGGRAWSGLAMNFNGTCGLWRRAAIVEAGGWEHDTLTEDMDLSYRAQLIGWRCDYRIGISVPGEVPATLSAWRSQQFRWAKGSIQTAKKLLPRIWRSSWSLHRKLAASLHMTHYLVHPLILLSLITAPPALTWSAHVPWWAATLGVIGFVVGAGAPLILYTASQLVLRGPSGLKRLRLLPALAGLGTGIAVSNTRAVWEALVGKPSEFVRTPKQGFGKGSYKADAATGIGEFLCAIWAAIGLLIGLSGDRPWILPLLLIYISGFMWVACLSVRERLAALRAQRQAGDGSPLPMLIPLGLAALAGYIVLAVQSGTWRDHPLLFAVIGVGIGFAYLASVATIRKRAGGGATVAWVLACAIAFRIACLGFEHSDDVNRYVLEARQVMTGQNPYVVAPADPSAAALVPSEIDAQVYREVNHSDMAAIYPPVTLYVEALVSEFAATPRVFQIAAAIGEIVALALVLALIMRAGLPPSLVLLAAWHPVGPLFTAGEGHNDVLMALLLVLAVGWSRHRWLGIAAASAAALAKPFAVIALLPHLIGRRWAWWMLPPALAILAYLPFADAGTALFASLNRFGSEMHFHGALEPSLRWLVSGLVGAELVRPIVLAALVTILVTGTGLVLLRHLRAEHPDTPRLTAQLMALLFICLPTLYPWYLLPIALLAPFTRSWGLLIWTALSPVFWLHGVEMQSLGEWTESPWVTAVAHLPALLLLAWEAAGRPTPGRGLRDDDLTTQTA